MLKKECNCFVTALISIIVGVIVGIVSFGVIIPGIINALGLGFGIGILVIGLLAVLAIFSKGKTDICICKNGICLAVGAIGTVITTIIGLSITIITGIVSISVLIGLATFFLVFTLLELLDFLFCLSFTNCNCRE